ncbi:MAG: PD-(D/E)XK nuclease family protein, partial [Raoultibacter sp.]
GSLSVENQNAVRIMTIHKSKGLEFPLVAVAAYDSSKSKEGIFLSTVAHGSLYLQLLAGAGAYKSPVAKEYRYKNSCSDQVLDPRLASDPAEFGSVLYGRESDEDAAEAKRKLYVALTRASECLIIGGIVQMTKSKDPLTWCEDNTPLLNNIREALLGDAYFPEEEAFLAYGGSAPARFSRIYVDPAKGGSLEDAETERSHRCNQGRKVEGFALPHRVRILALQTSEPLAYSPIRIREGVFSYSGIAPYEEHFSPQVHDDVDTAFSRVFDDEAPAHEVVLASRMIGSGDTETAPAATDFGTAFHRAAQFAVVSAPAQGGLLEMPTDERIGAIARHYKVAGKMRIRLDEALERWFASDVARRAESYTTMRAEVPFFVELDGGKGPLFMEGEIDLLCGDEGGTQAFVVDYKTGGSSEETLEQLRGKHLLQATCYAYAILTQGVDVVDFAFVRVEQHDAVDSELPQVVSYHFESADLPDLGKAILTAYEKSH